MLMEMVPFPSIRWLRTAVTLGSSWLVLPQGHVLEMVAALLALLLEWLQLVKVCPWLFIRLPKLINSLPHTPTHTILDLLVITDISAPLTLYTHTHRNTSHY